MERNGAHDRREIRSAEWRGAWRMLGVLVIAAWLGAGVFGALNSHVYRPWNRMYRGRLAGAISAYHRDAKAWPASFDVLRSYLRFAPDRTYEFSFTYLKSDIHSAEIATAVNGRVEAWRVSDGGAPEPLGGKQAFGTIAP